MKKTLALLIAVMMVFTLVSCASVEEPEHPEEQLTLVLGKDDVPRPNWVTKDLSTQDVHYAVGDGNLSNYSNSVKRAQAAARDLISEWVNVSVKEIVTTYANDSGSEANRQAFDAFETISVQKSQSILRGVKEESRWQDKEGRVYVLMSCPISNLENELFEAASEATDMVAEKFEKNEAAVEANKMMNEAITKYFGTGKAASEVEAPELI